MNVKEIIAAMIEAELWLPSKGKTPHLTLSSAFQRELKKLGKAAKFRKSPPNAVSLYTSPPLPNKDFKYR